MLLKIFTKRTAGGIQVQTELEWKEWMFEGNQIFKKDIYRGEDGEPKDHIGFNFQVVNGEETHNFTMFTSMMGYEIISDKGAIIEKFVTPVEETTK